jgi:hypothetical protein
MNSKVNDIYAAISRLNRTATKVPITGTVAFPDWDGVNDHIQGIAPKNGTYEARGGLSGSSTDGGYIATFQPSTVRATSIWPYQPEDYDHGGGAQMLGDLMAFAVESDDSNDNAQVGIYDLTNLAAPVLKYRFTVNGRKASAAAITNFTDGATEKVLLATYDYEPRHMRFFLANYSAVNGNTNPFSQVYHYTGNALDYNDQFQNFALVTSTSNVIYLLGFHENERLTVFEVQGGRNPFTITGLAQRAIYEDWKVAEWRYGVGLQIINNNAIQLWGTAKDPSGSSNDYSIDLYRYS